MNRIILSNIRNFSYMLLWFLIGFLYFAFYLISIIFSVAVSFTVVGVPMLAGVFRTIPALLNIDRNAAIKYAGIDMPIVRWNPQLKVTREISDKSNWFTVALMMFPRFILGFVSFIGVFVCYLIPIIMIFSPFLYQSFDMSIMAIPIDTLWRAILASIAGIVLLAVLSRLAGFIVSCIGGFTKIMIKTVRSWR
ncbi:MULTISPECIES: sensor domain-containing protein [unclassified Paenibacillus]|uniref:sensor domain-containing protein n=1 Tax=unclassified Paenibacillus TaxID=185978 RepID=UPI001C1194FD|nr:MULTISPECIES: sensor domain-containing protein [unclassified Paenibacillus]MBU5444822.1 sensor domain-containing protein [Paenibacillus sp. MSJ-34]CAH0121530.1 hypothetical protein PAE9249_04061 [Paenibacillus sp. CECT 9249]